MNEYQESLEDLKGEIRMGVCGRCKEDCNGCPGVQFLAEITTHLVDLLEPVLISFDELYEGSLDI